MDWNTCSNYVPSYRVSLEYSWLQSSLESIHLQIDTSPVYNFIEEEKLLCSNVIYEAKKKKKQKWS